MRTTISPTLLSLANKAAKVSLLKKLLKPAYYRYKDKIKGNRRKLFLENGLFALNEFKIALNRANTPYMLFAGTMLGAVREQGFIRHDVDIDVAIFANDYNDNINIELTKSGFKLTHSYEVDKGQKGREETYQINGVSIDIFYIYEDSTGMMYQCDFKGAFGSTSPEESMKKYGYVIARKIQIPLSRKLISVPFESTRANIPANYDEWLTKRYGDSYMTPDPCFSSQKTNDYIFEWLGEKAIYKSFS